MLTLINFLILMIMVLVAVAFVTLLERKILGYSQLRKGPNKVGIIGFPQPFNDAIKLFSKEMIIPISSNKSVYLIMPALAMFLALLVLASFPFNEHSISSSLTMIFIYMLMSMNIYPTLLSGWSSNSKYAIIGSLRAVSQTISYEVSLALILIFYLIMCNSFSFVEIVYSTNYWSKILLFLPLSGMWLISCLAETNRTPFDFAEGESELVSGFNIEYGAVGFALIFMAEYASIIFMSILFVMLLVTPSSNIILSYGVVTFLVFIWIWIRSTFPRYRYDMLMNLTWKSFLPVTLWLSILAVGMII
uniref:NADH dehydrogenase subunit 1 n=1 Tax=Pseudodiaptomus hessei TaxID=2919416 RepID=UPI002A822494|nr:NADH dehydrogenase subunit 1 [Pseudodiaptomus hessei]WOH21596.1 NADH dehydrogenase subunit 1 [Pseudodiaptomus hessei]